jgi:hypothetical protein
MITRTVSATPPSLRFVPEVTLIGLSSRISAHSPGDLVAADTRAGNEQAQNMTNV